MIGQKFVRGTNHESSFVTAVEIEQGRSGEIITQIRPLANFAVDLRPFAVTDNRVDCPFSQRAIDTVNNADGTSRLSGFGRGKVFKGVESWHSLLQTAFFGKGVDPIHLLIFHFAGHFQRSILVK